MLYVIENQRHQNCAVFSHFIRNLLECVLFPSTANVRKMGLNQNLEIWLRQILDKIRVKTFKIHKVTDGEAWVL